MKIVGDWKQIRSGGVIGKIWGLFSLPQRRSAVGLLALMMVGMFLETLGVGLVIPVIGLLSQPDQVLQHPWVSPWVVSLGNPDRQSIVVGAMLALLVVYLVKACFLAFLAWRQMSFSFNFQEEFSRRLFDLYLRQPYSFHLSRNSAQLIRNITGEVQVFTLKAMIPGMQVLSELLVLIGLSLLLVAVEPLGTLVVLAILMAAFLGFHRLTHKHVSLWGRDRQKHDGLCIQHLQQGLGGVKEVKLLGREREFLDKFAVNNSKSARAGRLVSTITQLPRLWLEALAVSGLVALVLVMSSSGRELDLILPTLALFAAAAFRLMPSVSRIISLLQVIRFGLPAVDKLYAEAALPLTEVSGSPVELVPFTDLIELRNVSYTYANAAKTSLCDISLKIRRGESIGFVGPSGAGKSTLVDVLLGLLRPGAGALLIDGVDIQGNTQGWQRHIGYVPQTIFLTDDSLRRNIAFGIRDEDIDHAAVQRSILAAQLDEFVGELPKGLETHVGERGVRLSGGQRQRIGIARALYHDPEVLVLDEATSALDTETEASVNAAVRSLHGEKTIIVVAHRLTTVAHCDRLYRLADGRIAASGSPEEMLSSNTPELEACFSSAKGE